MKKRARKVKHGSLNSGEVVPDSQPDEGEVVSDSQGFIAHDVIFLSESSSDEKEVASGFRQKKHRRLRQSKKQTYKQSCRCRNGTGCSDLGSMCARCLHVSPRVVETVQSVSNNLRIKSRADKEDTEEIDSSDPESGIENTFFNGVRNTFKDKQKSVKKVVRRNIQKLPSLVLPEDGVAVNNQLKIKPDVSIWTDKYKPENYHEVAVHAKKKSEIEAWFSNAIAGQANLGQTRMLFLCGPCGSAKSTMIQTLARDHHVKVLQWDDCTGIGQIQNGQSMDETWRSGNSYDGHASQIESFRRFVCSCRKYPSLPIRGVVTSEAHDSTRKIILLEHRPLVIGESFNIMEKFHELMVELCLHSRYSTVVIYNTTHGEKATPNRLAREFSYDAVTNPSTTIIHCNPIAKGILKKCLSNICQCENKIIQPDILEDIIDQSDGDLRHAINTLQYMTSTVSSYCVQSAQQGPTKDILHSQIRIVGKLLYGKDDPSINEGNEDVGNLASYVHQNFIEFYSDIDELCAAYNHLGLIDTILTSVFSSPLSIQYQRTYEDIAMALLGRTVSTTNQTPAATKFRPIEKPIIWKLRQQRRDTNDTVFRFGLKNIPTNASKSLLKTRTRSMHGRLGCLLDFNFYQDLIMNQSNHNHFKRVATIEHPSEGPEAISDVDDDIEEEDPNTPW